MKPLRYLVVAVFVGLSWSVLPATAHHECRDLAEAARYGDTSRMAALLQSGADANCTYESAGWGEVSLTTPLHAAAANARTAAVRLLLAHGANVNAVYGDGETALDSAFIGDAIGGGSQQGRDVMRILRSAGGKYARELK